jgi:predicted nucleic acid-binding Zn ribbon protein
MKDTSQEERYVREDYHRRRVPVRPAKPIGNLLSQLLARRGYGQVQSAAEFAAAWQSAVGQSFAAQTRCGRVRNGVLEVLAANSAVVQELTFQKAAILRKLSTLAPQQEIRNIRFKVGAVE